jgi:diphosphomevalonate decarboxylase
MSLSAQYTCPSNIAIVKYWGKYGNQLPRNASISFTLTNALSKTKVSLNEKGSGIEFYLDGKEKPSFIPKIDQFLSKIQDHIQFTKGKGLIIESSNTFPHSSGIASSASGMAAMALCILDIESQASGQPIDMKQASLLARLGSGSACRSLYPYLAEWGISAAYHDSSNEWAIPVYEGVHPDFITYHDDILIVSAEEKSVSSTAGHGLMDNNPYADVRYNQANDHVIKLKDILKSGDHHAFGTLAESEAMTLHALMMCSNPSYVLMQPGTLDVIKSIRKFRSDTQLPLYFTLDAGPNVHILYPDHIKKEAQDFIQSELLKFSPSSMLLKDQVGTGPVKL